MKQLAAKMQGLGVRLEAAMDEYVAASAAGAAEEARALAPVDSGELRAGIYDAKNGRMSAAAVSSAPHAAMVEYGTSAMAPKPYMLPAAERVREGYFADACAAVREVLK